MLKRESREIIEIKEVMKLDNKTSCLQIQGPTDAKKLKILAGVLKEYPLYTSLVLFGNPIGDERAKALAETLRDNHTLTYLDLSRNAIGDKGTKALGEFLKNNHTLTHVNLDFNPIDNEGAKVLAEALENNHTLTVLHLSINKISNEGAKALAEFLKKNHTLTALHLSINKIGEEGVKALAEALKKNHILTILNVGSQSLIEDKNREEIAKMLEHNRNNVKKVADFLVTRFIKKDNSPLKEESSHLFMVKCLKDYQVVDKALLKTNIDEAISHLKPSANPDKMDFAKLCKVIDSYINKNYFLLANICNVHEDKLDPISSFPEYIREHIASFMGAHSLWSAEEANGSDVF